ncbi:MAG: hypothetical protein CR977_00785 [Gammaproteobacteria bacterium]|nr:MAG: hypothetical protein CR977_00785 [Gammaproteobacteria bacterium]
MEKQTPFTLIRKGFFIGLGLIPALVLIEYASMQYGIYESKKMTEEITVHLNEQNAQVKHRCYK